MSDAEERLLNEIFDEFGARHRWDLVEYCHTLPEWTDPGDSALPIEYGEILRGGGKSEAETRSILDELENVALTEMLFR